MRRFLFLIFELVFISNSSLWLLTSHSEAAMLTFTFDDGAQSTFTIAYPILQKYNMPGVVYAISRRVMSYYEGYIHAEQLLEMQNDGWEIGSHSLSHRRTAQLPLTYDDEILTNWETVPSYPNIFRVQYNYDEMALVYVDGEQLWGSKTSINEVAAANQGYYFDCDNNWIYIRLAHNGEPHDHEIRVGSAQREIQQSFYDLTYLGLIVESFVPPFGSWDDSLREFAAPFYKSIVGCRPCDQSFNLLPLEVEDQPVSLTRTHSVKKDMKIEELFNIIQEAIAENAWIILSFHGIYNDDTFSDPYGWPKDKFEDLVVMINDCKIPVVTIREGLRIASLTLRSIIEEFGRTECSILYSCSADINSDGDVDGMDLAAFCQGRFHANR